MVLDLQKIRENFPSLQKGDYIYADNAGGSQCLKDVVDRLSDYLLYTNVQLGADYSVSVESSRRVALGSEFTAKLIRASSPDEIVYGYSSTMLAENLARSLEPTLAGDAELIITGEHEANTGPWKKLAARKGLTVKLWKPSRFPNARSEYAVGLMIKDLLPLITSKTRLIALSACSNILGSISDIAEIVKAARADAKEKGSQKLEFCVDCVAYAPHRRIDVKKWDVEYCFFSYYKVYGPHVSVLYVRSESLKSLNSLAHHFLANSVIDKPYKLQPGGSGYELNYASTGVLQYIEAIGKENNDGKSTDDIDAAFTAIEEQEQALLTPLLSYLTSAEAWERGVRVVGDEQPGHSRVPTISFVVVGERAKPSKEIVNVFDSKGNIGIRWGHFYAYTLIETLEPKLTDIDDGVVRISLVHYNTVEEVEKIVTVLKEALL